MLGPRSEVLACNALFRAVLSDLPVGSSFARFLLADPLARERITNWSTFAATAVAALRREMARHPDDRRLVALVDDLRADPEVAAWWNDHTVRDYASLTKHIRHPVAGDLTFAVEPVSPPHDPDQRLVVYTAEPDSDTSRLLPLLASWASEAVPTC